MNLSLVVLTPGKSEGKAIPITLTQFVIGRDPQCHLRPASSLISKRHCALLVRDGQVFVHDFDSTNGTFVNDQPVKGEVPIKHNDRLKVGPLLFAVRIEATDASDATTATATTPVASAPTVSTPAMPAPGEAKPAAAKPAAAKPAAAKPTAGKAPAPKPAAKTAAAPPPKPAPAPGGSGNAEDDIAAMLLETDGPDAGSGTGVEVPEGSTVMDIVAPQPGQDAKPPEAKDKDKAKAGTGNTSTAAAAILEQYRRRPRS